jgi:dTDP-glucose 4,6-dehydratase
VLGVHVLLEWVRESGVRLVHVSTDEVYGDVPEGRVAYEDDPLQPSSPYAASKAGADLQVLAYVRTFGVDASITRGSNAFGPFQYPEKLIPLFVTNALESEPLPLYGDGRQRRAWVYVEDQCAAIELVLRRGESGGVYNVGGEERENHQVANLIVELIGASPDLIRHVEDRPGHDRRYSLASERVSALGWEQTASFEEGLAGTVKWYSENPDWWRPLKSGEYRDYYTRQYAHRLGSAPPAP